ncbi:MAG: hypothetical protein WC415_06855, partial [Patescibacteria group bacterium]
QESYSIIIKRPISTKGKIFLKKILITCEDKKNIIFPIEQEIIDVNEEDNFIYKFNKIVFFNFWHNGDIHVSRSFVKFIMGLGYECEYLHNNDLSLLKDINIKCNKINVNYLKPNSPTHIRNNVLYINTWFSTNLNIFNIYKANFDCLYEYFKEIILKYFNIDITNYNIWDFFPKIDYKKCDIDNVNLLLNNYHGKKKIFISNGDVHSEQAFEFNFSPIINCITNKYKDFIFLISSKKNDIIRRDNLFFTEDIINIKGSDLNENSYLSLNSEVIIGRGSGPYSFSITIDNYQRNCKFIIFLKNEIMTYSWIKKIPMKYNAKIIGSDTIYIKDVYEIIDKELNKI